MEKGKLGLRLAFYGVTAFILAFLGYSTLLFLLAGVVLLVEKDEWASRQVLQALCLCVISSVISGVLDVADFMYDIPFLGGVWGTIIGIINAVINIIVLVFCLIGLVRNVSGKEANIPLASKFANWAFGIIVQPQQNYNQQAYGAPNGQFQQGPNTQAYGTQNSQFQQGPNTQAYGTQNGQFQQGANAQAFGSQPEQNAQAFGSQNGQNAQTFGSQPEPFQQA